MKASSIRFKIEIVLVVCLLAFFLVSGCDSDKGKGFRIKSFDVDASRCGRTVTLSWELNNSTKISGIDVYRKTSGSNETIKLTSSPLGPDSRAWTDTVPSGSSTFTYHISCLVPGKDAVKSSEKSVSVTDGQISAGNLSIDWSNGKPRLFWDSELGKSFRIYRSVDSGMFQEIRDTDEKEYADTLPESFLAVKYRVVVLSSGKDQSTGEAYECEGPASEFGITGRSYSSVSVLGAAEGRNRRFLIRPGGLPPFSLSGICQGLGDGFIARAVDGVGRSLAGETLAGEAFKISLDSAGTWEIVISSSDGRLVCRFFVTIAEDGTPPALTISDEGTVIETPSGLYTVSGIASDLEFSASGLEIRSDRFPGVNFACAPEQDGKFSCQVSLAYGMNVITVVASDLLGNKVEKTVRVNRPSPELPVISIESPVEGASIYEEKVGVRGTVRSILPKDQITLTIADIPASLQGGDGSYTFSVDGIRLVEGPNTIVAKASTPAGDSYARCHVTRFATPPDDRLSVPVISISTPSEGAFVSNPRLEVKGSVKCPAGISSVAVNGAAPTLSGSPFEMSFSSVLDLSGITSETYEIKVASTSPAGKTAEAIVNVRPDFFAPVISVDQAELLSYPAENRVRQNPYMITGHIIETNLSSFTVNDSPVNVTKDPSVAGKWRFSYPADLVRDRSARIDLEAKDLAGHKTTKSYILKLDTSFGYVIEILSPQPGYTINAASDPFNLSIVVRISGLSPDHDVSVLLDGNPVQGTGFSGGVFSATLSVPGKDSEHTISVKVRDRSGALVAERSSSFTVKGVQSGENLPQVKILRQEPSGNATGIEPNAFVAFYFDRPIDQTKLQIILKETVHGQEYDEKSGGDISSISSINLREVNRDQEAVPGGMSFFPEKTMAAFYPSRYFGYGASLYVTVSYEGHEILKSSFKVRNLPTLVQGVITDQFSRPLEGIEVKLSDKGRKTVTDSNGAYGFGFGDEEDNALPEGKHTITANPGMKNPKFGICEQFVTVRTGRLNQASRIGLPVINSADPYYFIKSGDNPATLSDGDLVLDLSSAGLLFPDGRNGGNIHVDMMDGSSISYTSVAIMPGWMFAVQPMGVSVSGSLGLTIKVPSAYGSYDYLASAGNLVLMIGYDPDIGRLVPVGVALLDKDAKTVTSAGRLPFKRLDYIGYVLADDKLQALLEKYMNNQISLDGIIAEIRK